MVSFVGAQRNLADLQGAIAAGKPEAAPASGPDPAEGLSELIESVRQRQREHWRRQPSAGSRS